jgi:transposase-like protein
LRFFQTSLNVQANMIQSQNGQSRPLSSAQGRFTAERVARTRPKTYRAIVHLLADPGATVMHIAKRHRVSEHTVRAIREREAQAIAERKQRLISVFGNVAEMSAERMEELCGKATLRDAGVSAGIATDKMLALAGQMPTVQIANIVMPSEEERAERRAIDDKLDAIFRRLMESREPKP